MVSVPYPRALPTFSNDVFSFLAQNALGLSLPRCSVIWYQGDRCSKCGLFVFLSNNLIFN